MPEFKVTGIDADNKYGKLPQDIVNMLKAYDYDYFREDKPVPFCGLYIYPAAVRDYETFSFCCSCLTLNKNDDPKGITTTDLGYLYSKMSDPDDPESKGWSYKLQKLCEIIFHIKNGIKCKKCGEVIQYDSDLFNKYAQDIRQYYIELEKMKDDPNAKPPQPPELLCPECSGKEFIEMIKFSTDPNTKKLALLIDGKMITFRDFQKLRQIVLFQNYPDYCDDSWVDPVLKKDHDEKLRLEQQKNDLHASIEEKVVCLSITTNYKFDEIYNMSVRKFTMALARVDDLINYKIMKQATMSGFVSLPKGKTIDHWIYKPNKDMYGDSYKALDEIQNGI